jgi:ATP-binding cassette subfamily B protein
MGGPMGGPMGGMRRGPGGMQLGRPVEKAKNFRGALKRLLGYLAPRKMNLIIVFILAICSTAFSIGAPKISALAINRLSDGVVARMTINQLTDVQKKLMGEVSSQAGKPQSDSGAVSQLSPAQTKDLQELIKIPLISDIKDADQKADNVKKLSELLKSLPSAEKGKSLSSDQLNNAIRAIRETNGIIDFKYIGLILLVLLGVYAISSLFTFTTNWVMSSVAQKTVYDMRKDLDDKLARLPLKYFDSRTHGEILSRMTNDIDTISQTLQQSMTQLITSIVQIVGIIVMMLVMSPMLTVIVLLALPLYILVTSIVAKKSQRFSWWPPARVPSRSRGSPGST